LEDENTQLKETLRRSEAAHSPLRARGDIAKVDTFERAWTAEKLDLQLEMERLKGRLKATEEQRTRDVGLIATLEERLKESSSGSTDLDDLDGEHLNDEMNTSRKNLFDTSPMSLILSRLQVARLERELAASKAEAEFNKAVNNKYTTFQGTLTNSENETDLRERFVKYEMELSAANRKIADRNFPM
jgi:hypothetical protein